MNYEPNIYNSNLGIYLLPSKKLKIHMTLEFVRNLEVKEFASLVLNQLIKISVPFIISKNLGQE